MEEKQPRIKTGDSIQKRKSAKKFKQEQILQKLEKAAKIKEKYQHTSNASDATGSNKEIGRKYTVSLALPGSICGNNILEQGTLYFIKCSLSNH